MPIDVFIDFSRVAADSTCRRRRSRGSSEETAGRGRGPRHLRGRLGRRAVTTCADAERLAHPVDGADPVEACRDAIAAAADDDRPLLVLIGDIQPARRGWDC